MGIRAQSPLRQRTFYVGDRKVVIKSRAKTWCGNRVGWNVWVNGKQYFNNRLTRQEAEDAVYAKWVKEQADG